jgi:hypothetical protein
MMGTLQRADASVRQSLHRQDAYSRSPADDNMRSLRAAATSPPLSLAERVRTFVDRTLDAAFGRFDH